MGDIKRRGRKSRKARTADTRGATSVTEAVSGMLAALAAAASTLVDGAQIPSSPQISPMVTSVEAELLLQMHGTDVEAPPPMALPQVYAAAPDTNRRGVRNVHVQTDRERRRDDSLRQAEVAASEAADKARVLRELEARAVHRATNWHRRFHTARAAVRVSYERIRYLVGMADPDEDAEAEEAADHDEEMAYENALEGEPNCGECDDDDGDTERHLSERSCTRYAQRICADLWTCDAESCGRVLGKAAVRLRSADALMADASMKFAAKRHDAELLKETKEHLLTGALRPEVWAKWKHLTHTSVMRLKLLRTITGHDTVQVYEPTDDDDGVRLCAKRMHPAHAITFQPVPTREEIDAASALLRNNESAVPAKLGSAFTKRLGASMSLQKTLVTLCKKVGEAGVSTVNFTAEHPGKVLQAGDGFRCGGKKAVRVGFCLTTTTGLNQSPNDWLDFLLYEGGEAYAEVALFLEPLLVQLRRIYCDGYVTDVETGRRFYLEFALGGDKPWILDAAGHRNMNFSFPQASCKCSKATQNDFTKSLDEHACERISCEDAVRLTHVDPFWHFKGGAGRGVWGNSFPCPAGSACRWGEVQEDGSVLVTKASVDAFNARLAGMTENERKAEVRAPPAWPAVVCVCVNGTYITHTCTNCFTQTSNFLHISPANDDEAIIAIAYARKPYASPIT